MSTDKTENEYEAYTIPRADSGLNVAALGMTIEFAAEAFSRDVLFDRWVHSLGFVALADPRILITSALDAPRRIRDGKPVED